MLSQRRALPHRAARFRPAARSLVRTLAIIALVAPTVLAAGCSSPEKSEIVVAEVGPRTITLDYFERKMNTMDPSYVPSDVNTQEGRAKLLDIMVNKEVMALKAEELGMAADGQADQQAEQVAMLRAVARMREDVTAPAQNPTEKDILDYYEKLPRKLTVSFMLFDHYEPALEAKRLVEGGELWRTVADKLSVGQTGPSGDYTLKMQYGTVADDIEKVVFDLPVGAVSDPIDSIYGWFVIRVDDIELERVQPLDTLRDKVRESVVKQDSQLLISAFIEEIFEQYGFEIDEEVLQLVFDGFPEQDPPLNPPPPMEDLVPLDVAPANLDRVLMRYDDEVWTVRRFADYYDGMSAFARPRRERRIGHFRRFLKEQALRDLMQEAARDRGYLEDPLVQDEFKMRREQAMVTRLHSELIADEVKVAPAEVDSFWAVHAEEYFQPERREVLAVVAPSESEALNARLDAQSGKDWAEVVETYCIESDIKQQKGRVSGLTADDPLPLAQAAFELSEIGDMSMPTEIGPDQWLLVKLTNVYPAEQPELADIRQQVARRLQSIKEEQVFQEKVQQWRSEYTIKTHPEQLMKAVYDPNPPSQSIPVQLGGGA